MERGARITSRVHEDGCLREPIFFGGLMADIHSAAQTNDLAFIEASAVVASIVSSSFARGAERIARPHVASR